MRLSPVCRGANPPPAGLAEEINMVKQDLHELPKVRDSLSYLYVEHARI